MNSKITLEEILEGKTEQNTSIDTDAVDTNDLEQQELDSLESDAVVDENQTDDSIDDSEALLKLAEKVKEKKEEIKSLDDDNSTKVIKLTNESLDLLALQYPVNKTPTTDNLHKAVEQCAQQNCESVTVTNLEKVDVVLETLSTKFKAAVKKTWEYIKKIIKKFKNFVLKIVKMLKRTESKLDKIITKLENTKDKKYDSVRENKEKGGQQREHDPFLLRVAPNGISSLENRLDLGNALIKSGSISRVKYLEKSVDSILKSVLSDPEYSPNKKDLADIFRKDSGNDIKSLLKLLNYNKTTPAVLSDSLRKEHSNDTEYAYNYYLDPESTNGIAIKTSLILPTKIVTFDVSANKKTRDTLKDKSNKVNIDEPDALLKYSKKVKDLFSVNDKLIKIIEENYSTVEALEDKVTEDQEKYYEVNKKATPPFVNSAISKHITARVTNSNKLLTFIIKSNNDCIKAFMNLAKHSTRAYD